MSKCIVLVIFDDLAYSEHEETEMLAALNMQMSPVLNQALAHLRKVLKEFKRRTKKIWISELNAKNKIIGHNTFAVSMVTPTICVLDWTKNDIKSMDIMTRKQITMTGGFHHASDINRLYAKRSDGGRVLKNIEDSYELKMVSLSDHIRTVSRVKKNRPHLILWDKEDKTCKIIEVMVPLDSYISAAYMQKESKHIPLIQNLSQFYS